jgi:hypothetical protein
MAKKSAARGSKAPKRNIRRVDLKPTATVEAIQEEVEATRAVQAPSARPTPMPVATPYRPSSPVFRRVAQAATPVPTDYSYVRHDLQRIGILTGLIILTLIALTFVLR